MYKSPIELLITDVCNQVLEQQNEAIHQAVLHYVPNVDRDELVKALEYDRSQYEEGYMDGKADAMAELVRCVDCNYRRGDFFGGFCCSLHKGLAMVTDESFCSYGERKDNE